MPVWAVYSTHATVEGADGSGRLRLPSHRCERGHISGWRPEDDFLADLAMEVERTELGDLNAGTVPARKRVLARDLCGACGGKLRITLTGGRVQGRFRRWVKRCPDPVELELDIPASGCERCGARPDLTSPACRDTPSDIELWLFMSIAGASLQDPDEVHPRIPLSGPAEATP